MCGRYLSVRLAFYHSIYPPTELPQTARFSLVTVDETDSLLGFA